jgi:hypothetical protein
MSGSKLVSLRQLKLNSEILPASRRHSAGKTGQSQLSSQGEWNLPGERNTKAPSHVEFGIQVKLVLQPGHSIVCETIVSNRFFAPQN